MNERVGRNDVGGMGGIGVLMLFKTISSTAALFAFIVSHCMLSTLFLSIVLNIFYQVMVSVMSW